MLNYRDFILVESQMDHAFYEFNKKLPTSKTRDERLLMFASAHRVQMTASHLDVLGGLEPIQLVEELQHSSLHLTVSSWSSLQPRRADGVDLIHEDDGGCVFPGHDEQLSHHTSSWNKHRVKQEQIRIIFKMVYKKKKETKRAFRAFWSLTGSGQYRLL